MTETEFLARWTKDCPIYEDWGKFVCGNILDLIGNAFPSQPVNAFVKIPAHPRVKTTESLLAKAFRRGKEYSNPYSDITDKVGVRFVLLTVDDVVAVCGLIERSPLWTYVKARDFGEEQRSMPNFFSYQSMHYIVCPTCSVDYEHYNFSENIACEVQIRTLLQHAWSELSHDIVYKPNTIAASPDIERLCSRAAALVETVDEIFSRVSQTVEEASKPLETTMSVLYGIYIKRIAACRYDSAINMLLLDTYLQIADRNIDEQLISFYDDTKNLFIIEKIKQRQNSQIIYRQPSILLVYYFAKNKKHKTKSIWPFTPEELHPIYSDLGLSFLSI